MDRGVNLDPLGGTDCRTRVRLVEAKLRTALGLRRFSESENLLYGLAKHDAYLRITLLFSASAKSIRERQWRQHQVHDQTPTISLKEILTLARCESIGLSHARVSGEHLLLALLKNDQRSAAVLREFGLTYERAKQIISERGISRCFVNLWGFRPTFWSRRIR
jgi:ATP-dependent Clp protease ATP-binding subunit ClpA